MNFASIGRIPRKALAALAILSSLAFRPAAAEEFTCGTTDESAVRPLEKAAGAPLPNIRVYKGVLKAVVFRVEFADVPSNVTEETIRANNVIINDFYKAMSRGLFSWEFSIYPTVLKAPGTRAEYDGNFNALRSWISTAVTATGLKRGTDFAVYNVTFPQVANLGWSGLSSGGTSGQNYMNGSYGTGVTAHEMGHTVGLAHAHAINAGTTDFFGTPGTEAQHVEYGHPFDVMGRGGSNGHFNICYKYRDGWTDSGNVEVQEVSKPGVYRLYAHDNAEHKGRLLGIHVPAGDPEYGYWFEYRSNSTTNRKGASVMFEGFTEVSGSRADTWFMDLTPATSTDNDGVMAPNMEFKDKYGTTAFKVIGINAVAGAEGWVDVAVSYNGQPVGVLAGRPHALRAGAQAGAGLRDLMGRALRDPSALQTLVLRERGGSALRLNLEAR
jgi:hypothetical protein